MQTWGTGQHGATSQPQKNAESPASTHVAAGDAKVVTPRNTSVFFSIYFAMTGLHGIHVVAGIIVYIWLLWRALKGEFGPKQYAAIDFAALYWHLVDLVWIYLFPLLSFRLVSLFRPLVPGITLEQAAAMARG